MCIAEEMGPFYLLINGWLIYGFSFRGTKLAFVSHSVNHLVTKSFVNYALKTAFRSIFDGWHPSKGANFAT